MANAQAVHEIMADPTRRAIVERLADGPAAVGDLARDLPVTRSAVSQHLHLLKQVGLTGTATGGRACATPSAPAGA